MRNHNTAAAILVVLGTASSFGQASTELISRRCCATLTPGNAASRTNFAHHRTISSDGRYVIFASGASNFCSCCGDDCGDPDGTEDLVVRDRMSNTTNVLVNNTEYDVYVAEVSRNGEYVVYEGADLLTKRRNRDGTGCELGIEVAMGALTNICEEGLQFSATEEPTISADGSQIAFGLSWAGPGGLEAPGIMHYTRSSFSPDVLQFVAGNFGALCANGGIVGDICGHDVEIPPLQSYFPSSRTPVMDSSGRYVAFVAPSDDEYHLDQVYVFDAVNRTVALMSAASGTPANEPAGTDGLAISGNGRWIGFASRASNLVSGVDNGLSQIFVRDRLSATLVCVSRIGTSGPEGNGDSYSPSISDDGKFVTFESYATNLVPGANGNRQVYRRNRDPDGNGVFENAGPFAPAIVSTLRVSLNSTGGAALSDCTGSCISGNGSIVVFTTSDNLLNFPQWPAQQVYARVNLPGNQ